MYPLFVILIVIVAILMIAIVLIQESKGGGLSAGFSTGNAVLGVRKTTDFIEKATWGLAIFICVCAIASAFTVPHAVNKSGIEQVQAPATTNTAAPAAEKQAAPAPAAEAPATEAPAAPAN